MAIVAQDQAEIMKSTERQTPGLRGFRGEVVGEEDGVVVRDIVLAMREPSAVAALAVVEWWAWTWAKARSPSGMEDAARRRPGRL